MVRHQKRKSTRQGGRPSKRSKSQDSDEDDQDDDVECWYCLKRGHFEIDCRLKKQADKNCRKREKHRAKASLATAIEAPKTMKEPTIQDIELW